MGPRLLSAVLLAAPLLASAAPLGDPTRPPGPAAPAPAPAGPHAARPAPHASAPAPAAAAPQLQSVQLRVGSPSALVDGRLVQPGDRVGTRTVIAIDAQGLVLKGEGGRSERLDLLGGVTKHLAGAAPANASVQARRSDPPAAEPVVAAATAPASPAASQPPAGRTTP